MGTDFAAWDPENKARMIQECLEKIKTKDEVIAVKDAEIAALKEERQVLLNEVRRLYRTSAPNPGFPFKEGTK
jgi:uncharacterized membrane protein